MNSSYNLIITFFTRETELTSYSLDVSLKTRTNGFHSAKIQARNPYADLAFYTHGSEKKKERKKKTNTMPLVH